MSNVTFTLATAQQLLESNQEFPVDFELARQWLNYSRKDSAKRFLIENLEEDIDFHISVEIANTFFGTKVEKISLSIEGFKSWAMMSKTETGKLVRKYFLECERQAKKFNPASLSRLDLLKLALEAEEQRLLLEAQVEQQAAQLEEQKPLVEFAKTVQGADDSMKMSDFCDVMGVGRTTFYKHFRDMGVLEQNSTPPYSKHIQAGYFEVSEKPINYGDRSFNVSYTLITPKGQTWLHKKYQEFLKMEKARDAAELATPLQ